MDNTKRDQEIVASFMRGDPVPKISNHHGVSVPQVNRILKEQNVDRSQRERRTQTYEERVVDNEHLKIGGRLYAYRNYEAHDDRGQAGEKLGGWSAKRVAMVEQGHTLLNLSDLSLISKYMQQPLSKLLEDL